MFRRIPHPSPAFVVAMLALFVALSGTAVAAGIVPRAKLADNATKLQGKTPTQVAALARAPVALAGYVTVKSASWTLGPSQGNDFAATCDAGQKAQSACAKQASRPAAPSCGAAGRPRRHRLTARKGRFALRITRPQGPAAAPVSRP